MLALHWLVAGALIAVCGAALWRVAHPSRDPTGARAAMARYAAHPSAVLAMVALIALYVLSALAPWLATHDPISILEGAVSNQAPSPAFLFGTDYAGRDVFSRVLYGARISLSIALLATTIAVVVGTLWGITAGFPGGRVDTL
ncbi:MAG: hypothetical protein ACHQRL_09565, partial [Gemmatimonadales bacterium]